MSTRAEPLAGVVAVTPMGAAGVALSPQGIRHATLFHPDHESAWAELRAVGARAIDDPRANDIRERLMAYAGGDRGALAGVSFDLPECTPFSRAVWLGLLDIPAGETRSYGWLAKHVGQPVSASRAVGRAVGANPIPLWLPCHRVLASDGSLHGFGGGLAMKRQLLELERAIQPALV